VPLTQIGGDGVFVTEIERALREGRIDLAVHSLKDLPTATPADLHIVVPGPREDVRDLLVAHDNIPIVRDYSQQGVSTAQTQPSWRIGTCSLRRSAQIRALYPSAQIVPIRGNVDTRLRKLEAGEYDAIILASAGLHRLQLQAGLVDCLTYFPLDMMMPAPGQGALALECRNEAALRDLLEPLRDMAVQAATCAERMFMRELGAGCYLPVGAYGEIIDDALTLRGLVISLDGQRCIRVNERIPWTPGSTLAQAEQLGVRLAEQALAQGADRIIHELTAAQEQEGQHV